ncbi:rRNA 2'-O-methyltransferase fibrillarin [Drosophila novamexicana]|uniref:rRNA 2'-O-methyltransferase fibrillarin n=1 Tax=Drosophila novamexicana TaxID=47314 RepID=UPI0011E5951E|nr:rRNA 2'-O-methyltransferase fibrillarin [Drosophila novamexicana]
MEKLAASNRKCRGRGQANGRGWSMLGDAGEVDSNEGSDYGSDNSFSSTVGLGIKSDISIEPQEFCGAYLVRGKEDLVQLVTRCSASTYEDYGEEMFLADYNEECCKFRTWSPYQSKLAAALLKGIEYIQIFEGTKVMYLGAASGCSVSHLADIVGEEGIVYAVETSPWANSELLELAKRRHNVVAITEDVTLPYKYRRIVVDSVDFLFCDTLHHEQLRLLILHARHYLRPGGHFAIMLPGAPQDCVSAVNRLHAEQLETLDQSSLLPFVHGQVMAAGIYNPTIHESLIE